MMAPDSFSTYRDLEAQIVEIGKATARIETKITLMCEGNRDRQTTIDKRLDNHGERLDEHQGRLDAYASWGKVVGLLGSIIILVLALLNILSAVGVDL